MLLSVLLIFARVSLFVYVVAALFNLDSVIVVRRSVFISLKTEKLSAEAQGSGRTKKIFSYL